MTKQLMTNQGTTKQNITSLTDAYGNKRAMDKQQIIRSIVSEYGEFVSLTEVASFLRIDRGTARQLMNGVPYLGLGRKKLFNASDVAQRIKERSQV